MISKRKDTSERPKGGWVATALLALLFGFALGIGSSLIFTQMAFAQADASTPQPQQEAPQGVTPDQVNNVARELWCPLCSGVRLDACELKACEQMRDVIAVKLSEGEDTESIKSYFVAQYGPQVMGEPPRQGFNWLAWTLPALVAVVGGYFFWRTTQRMMQPAAPLATNGEVESRISDPIIAASAGTTAAKPAVGDPAEDDDEYTQKLDEELAKYG